MSLAPGWMAYKAADGKVSVIMLQCKVGRVGELAYRNFFNPKRSDRGRIQEFGFPVVYLALRGQSSAIVSESYFHDNKNITLKGCIYMVGACRSVKIRLTSDSVRLKDIL